MRLFAFHGGASRKEYFLHALGSFLAYLAVLIFAVLVLSDPGASKWASDFVAVLYLLVVLLIAVDDIGVTLRRLEDLGRPRSHFWLLFIPLYNIYLGLVLLFQAGDSKSEEPTGAALPSAESPGGGTPAGEFICSRCGRDITWGDPFCPSCGDTIEY
jgi:uncharacterized membrane protein YhaH (DUF805 family)